MEYVGVVLEQEGRSQDTHLLGCLVWRQFEARVVRGLTNSMFRFIQDAFWTVCSVCICVQ